MKEEFKACFVSNTHKASFELLLKAEETGFFKKTRFLALSYKSREIISGFPDFNPESRKSATYGNLTLRNGDKYADTR
ncbi:MAG: hypothetical protein GY749_16945 [Desulfobacteraceae bacterium]|nr:hypothetical protein [Desulfobacteraceae bacterium]